MPTISIEDATATQLADFAGTTFGIETTFRDGKEKILSKLADVGYTDDTIEIPEVHKGAPVAPAAPADGVADCEFVTILIDKQSGKPAMEFLSHNGVGIYIKRGVPSRVNKKYLHVLSLMEETTYEPSLEGLPEASMAPAIPFRVVAYG